MTNNKYLLQTTNLLAILSIIILSNLFFLNCSYMNSQPIIVEKTENIKEIAQFDDNFGYFRSIKGEKDTLIVSSFDRLYIFNVSNVVNPFIETEIPIYDVKDVFLKDNILYVIQNNQFQIYSFINKSLLLLDSLTYNVSCLQFAIREDYAYIMLSEGNMSIIDISDPNILEERSNFSVGEQIKNFCLFDNFLYILNSDFDFIVKNITDVLNITTTLNYHVGAAYYSNFEIINGYMYFINGTSNELVTYNCTLPTIFEYVTSCSDCFGFYLEKKDNLIIVLSNNNLQIINVTDVETPIKISDEELLSGAPGIKDVYIRNATLFITEWSEGLTIINISDSTQPTKITNIGIGGDSRDILAFNDCLIVCDYNGGIEILTIEEESEIVKRTSYKEENETSYFYSKIINVEGILYVTTGTKTILLLEMMENNSLAKIGEYQDPESSLRKIVSNNKFLFINAGNGIVVLDIKNRLNPEKIDFYYDGSAIIDITVKKSKLYVLYSRGVEQGIRIYDVSDPLNKVLAGDYQLEYNLFYGKIKLHGNNLFVGLEEELLIIDVASPAQMNEITIYDKNDSIVTCLVFAGNYICVGMVEGISIIDTNDKTNLTEKAYYYDGGTANSIIVEDNKLIIADGLDGVEVLETAFNLDTNTLIYFFITLSIIGVLGVAIGIMVYLQKKKK